MQTIRILVATCAVSTLLAGSACKGLVAPGRTAGDTYGGAWSAQFAPKEEKKDEKKEEKKEEKKPEKPVVADPGPFDKPGFITREVKGRVWVFKAGSKELGEFLKTGESAKSITLIGRGPNGMSLRSPDKETAEAYLAAP